MNDEAIRKELQELCDLVADQNASQEQAARLEEIVRSSPEYTKLYTEYFHLDSCLGLLVNSSAERMERLSSPSQSVITVYPFEQPRFPHRQSQIHWSLMGAGSLLLVLFMAGILRPYFTDAPVATIAKCTKAKWGATTLPTAQGSRLRTGRLQLLEGMAVIQFDSAVTMNLEAPAELEISSASKCRLLNGRMLAQVSRGGEGFTVETPFGILKDKGTEFGVHVNPDGITELCVFNGSVDAQDLAGKKATTVRTGEFVRITSQQLEHGKTTDELSPQKAPSRQESNYLQISTASGNGRDAFIIPPHKDNPPVIESELLVKFAERECEHFNRKVYLGFDLESLGKKQINKAELELSLLPGYGYAALCPDAVFAVYGIADGDEDYWTENNLSWNSAPGNDISGNAMNKSAILLGRFTIPQGCTDGRFGIQTEELAKFLNQDSNGQVTLAVVRETRGVSNQSIIHVFASREHTSVPAPLLRLFVSDAPNQPL